MDLEHGYLLKDGQMYVTSLAAGSCHDIEVQRTTRMVGGRTKGSLERTVFERSPRFPADAKTERAKTQIRVVPHLNGELPQLERLDPNSEGFDICLSFIFQLLTSHGKA